MPKREYYQLNKKKCRGYANNYYQRHKQGIREGVRMFKLEVFSHYSNGVPICARCGFSDTRALSIDHIGGGGNKHRRQLNRKGGMAFYRWLRQESYPEGFQVLCYNCQRIKGIENKEQLEEK